MKQNLLLAFLVVSFAACKDTTPPKEVAKEFIAAVYTADATTASSLATEKTKTFIADRKTPTPATPAAESFSFATLTETVNGNSAEVKNEAVKLVLEKEGSEWKVVVTPDAVSSIENRQAVLAMESQKWQALLKEYEARMRVAKDYVQSKKGAGTLSAPVQKLETSLAAITEKREWNKAAITRYMNQQTTLAGLIDKALEPSYAANSDLSMNYIIQMSNANERVKAAEGEYAMMVTKR